MKFYHSTETRTSHVSNALQRHPNNPKEERSIWEWWLQFLVWWLYPFGACEEAEYHSGETWKHRAAHLLVAKKEREKGPKLPLSLSRYPLKIQLPHTRSHP